MEKRELDKYSFILGMITAFCECVASGCKRMALSPPMQKDDYSMVVKEANQIIETLKNDSIHVEFMGNDLEITPSMVIISVNVKEGYCSSNNGRVFVILNTELTEDLILEGLAREFVRKVQSLRKDNDYVITDRINVYYDGNDMLDKMILKYNEYIKNETLAVELVKDSSLNESFDMNGISVKVKTERV